MKAFSGILHSKEPPHPPQASSRPWLKHNGLPGANQATICAFG